MTTTLQSAISAITATLAAVGWFVGLRAADDDATTAEAHEFVLDALSNADAVRTIECITDRNLRDQLTIADALELQREAELRRCDRRN